ncbi:Ribosomal RNA small subunit methyltransferase A [Frankliniella fusca]|uniref:Ribosomal RNA small subunit methyltransferase A n=1 Tax=Frankliniella fusca TaxID=407009 RepID=A0AAE1LMI6_9NEOP|nr:Ribosomal RNA small subunit methyltransferase A [Frankliniella fusca]
MYFLHHFFIHVKYDLPLSVTVLSFLRHNNQRSVIPDGTKCWQALQKHKRQGGLSVNRTHNFLPIFNSTMNEDCRSPAAKRGRKAADSDLNSSFSNLKLACHSCTFTTNHEEDDTHADEVEEILATSLSDIDRSFDGNTRKNQQVLITNLPNDFKEFTKESLAIAAIGLKKMYYLGQKVFLTPVKENPSLLQEPIEHTEKKAILSGFSKGCKELLLEATIKTYMINAGIINQTNELLINIEGCSDNAKEIFIEFENDTLAEAAASSSELYYLGDKISVMPFKPHQKSIFEEKDKRKIVLSGFSKGCEEFLLEATIKNYLIHATIINRTDVLSLNIEGCCNNAKEIVIEFKNDTLAEAAASLEEIYYLGDKIPLMLFTKKNTIMRNDKSFQDDRSSSIVVESLDSEKGTLAFLKACYKCGRVPFQGTLPNLLKVQEFLLKDYCHVTTVEKLARKKKTLDELHRRNPCNEYCKEMAFLRGEKNAAWPELDEMGDDDCLEDDIMKGTKFTKGTTMPTTAIYTLIVLWKDNRKEYWSVHKDSRFHTKISMQMVLRGYKFSPAQCRNKIKDLEGDFKTYSQSLKRTGQGRPRPFEFY